MRFREGRKFAIGAAMMDESMDAVLEKTATAPADDDSWSVAGRTFRSRLIVGTGKYRSFEQNAAAVEASGAEIVTVAVRRVNIARTEEHTSDIQSLMRKSTAVF